MGITSSACITVVFLRISVSQGKDGPGILKAFSNPARSMAKAVMQTTGELDYDTLFNEANLLYSPMAYILFISFVVLMPILFSNLLVREATLHAAISVGYFSREV